MFKAQTDGIELKIHAHHNSNSASVSSLDYLNIFAPDKTLFFFCLGITGYRDGTDGNQQNEMFQTDSQKISHLIAAPGSAR